MVNAGYMTMAGFGTEMVSQFGLRHTTFPTNATCGGVNVMYLGYPAHHPMVSEQGYNTDKVDYSLRHGAADLVKAGYNIRVVWSGPEVPLSELAERTVGVEWDAWALGWGIRGHGNGTSTERHENIQNLFREILPTVPTVYNWGPHSFVEAITRRIPIKDDCTQKPGTLLGYEEICEPDVCPKSIRVTDGKLETLLAGLPSQ